MTAPTTFCNECGASNPLQATYCFACNNALQPSAPSPLLPIRTASSNAAVLTSKGNGPLAPFYLLHSRYSIDSQIGTGGFGAVYQAQDTLFSNRLVAIKEMNQESLSPRELAEATAAFEREALVLTDLTHPNLPRIHDYFTEHRHSYVVMDYIAGDTLEDYLDKVVRRLPVEMVLEIGIQLCTVLDYLHTHQPPLIFRDIKPANIMRTVDNHVYLIDFGIARHFKPGKAKDTIPLGSKGYAAPEQYGKAQTTPQSDIYGLGATLHQLLTGDDPSLTLFHFEPVRLHKSPISAQLNALLKQMVEMEMSKRPANMAIVKQELQHLLAQQTARTIRPSQKVSRGMVRRRSFLLGLSSVVAACSGSIAITAYVFANPNIWGASSTHPLIANTPVISSSTPASPPGRAVILSKPLYTYRGHTGSVTAVAWSPQGQHVASAGTLDRSVQVWDANTGNIIPVPGLIIDTMWQRLPIGKKVPAYFATGNLKVDALAWSPDSRTIASAADNVQLWNGLTGEQIFTYTKHAVHVALEVQTVAWSPNGRYIASGGMEGTVQVWNAR